MRRSAPPVTGWGQSGSEEHPARDFHTLRVHPRQLIAEQGGDGVADIIRQPNAPQRSLGGDMPIHLGVIAHLPPPKSVSMAPGAMMFTDIPRPPSSFA